MTVRIVRCKEVNGEKFISLSDLRNVLESQVSELIGDMAKIDDKKIRNAIDNKREAYRDVADALTKYEIQMGM
jgi:hypothetical protein